MRIRILKKKNINNRVQYIADKIGVIQRSFWVEYFKKHPKDLPKVLKKLRNSYSYKSLLKHDVRTNYRGDSFDQKLCNWTIWRIENGYFGQYVKLDISGRLLYDLTCIPTFGNNPYGLRRITGWLERVKR